MAPIQTKKPYIQWILWGFTTILLIVLLFKTCKPSLTPVYQGKPNIVVVPEPYTVFQDPAEDDGRLPGQILPEDIYTSPKEILVFPKLPKREVDVTRNGDSIKVTPKPIWNLDSIYTKNPGSSLEIPSDDIWYSTGFLYNYPKNPKLIRLYANRGNLSLDILYPNDTLVRKRYNVDLTQYEYYWEGDSLRAKALPTVFNLPNPKFIKFESNAYTEINPFNGAIRLGADGAITYRRVGLYGKFEAQTIKPYVSTYLGFRFKLK